MINITQIKKLIEKCDDISRYDNFLLIKETLRFYKIINNNLGRGYMISI